ncbi:MAG: hypothetical protein ACON5F_13095 [Jejuia sp.]
MKTTFITLILIFTISLTFAQEVKGALTLNGKSKSELKLETNSAVQLFKDFKTGKYKLKFSFDGDKLPTNVYKEDIVFFEFMTSVKKDGKLVKNVIRKQPIPYFPGDMGIPAEAFDFVGLLASNPMEDEDPADQMIGTIPEGSYEVQLSVKPVGFKGNVNPVSFYFKLRTRPGR